MIEPSSQAINIAAFAIYEPNEPLLPFIPSWFNVWESYMLRRASHKIGSTNWSFKRYGVNHDIYLREGIRKTNCRSYLFALEHVFDSAFSQLNKKQQFLFRKERNGIIYVDSWGELTSFEHVDSLRDLFTINIIPRNMIKKYNIKDLSCKVRGERNGFISALLLAQNLINNNVLDNIFISGGYRAIPILAFTEIECHYKSYLSKPTTFKTINHIERTFCFIVNKKEYSNIFINVNRYFLLPIRKNRAIKILLNNWLNCINDKTTTFYTTLLPIAEFIAIEQAAFKQLSKHFQHYIINELYGDSGFITPALMLEHLDSIKNYPSHNIMTAIDGERGVWLIECWKQ